MKPLRLARYSMRPPPKGGSTVNLYEARHPLITLQGKKCLEANAGPESEDALLWLFRKYPQIQSKFVKAPLQHDSCAPPFYETFVSFDKVLPAPPQYALDEFLEFICDLFI